MDPIPRFEVNDTRQFVLTLSTAPGTRPFFTITADSGGTSLVHSVSCTSSSSTAWFAHFTIPSSAANHVLAYAFACSYSDGQVVNRGLFHATKTTPIA